MKLKKIFLLLGVLWFCFNGVTYAQVKNQQPVASAKAKQILQLAISSVYDEVMDEKASELNKGRFRSLSSEEMILFKDISYILIHIGYPENVPGPTLSNATQKKLANAVMQLVFDNSSRKVDVLSKEESDFVIALETQLRSVLETQSSSYLDEEYKLFRNHLVFEVAPKQKVHPIDVKFSEQELDDYLSAKLGVKAKTQSSLNSNILFHSSAICIFPWVSCTSITFNNWGTTVPCAPYQPCVSGSSSVNNISDDGGCELATCDIYVTYNTSSLLRGVNGTTTAAQCVTGTNYREKTFSAKWDSTLKTMFLFGGGTAGYCGVTSTYLRQNTRATSFSG